MALLDNLIVLYELEANGNDAHNVGPYNLTAVNTPTFVAGHVGNAADLLTNQYFTHASNADLQTGDIAYSIATWVYLDSVSEFNMLGSKWGAVDADKEWSFDYHGGINRFRFNIRYSGGTIGAQADNFGAPSAATYYFVACGHDPTTDRTWISVNAGTSNEVAYSGTVGSPGNFRLEVGNGSETVGFPMNGRLDQWGFWKRDIRSDLTELYNGGAGLSYASMSGGGGSGQPMVRRSGLAKHVASFAPKGPQGVHLMQDTPGWKRSESGIVVPDYLKVA